MSQQKINVLVIAPYRFLPAINGGHKAIERLYSHLGLAVNVTVVSVMSNDASLANHFRLKKLFSDSPLHYLSLAAFFQLKKIVRREKITHIITDHPYMGWLAFLLKHTQRVLWVMRSHNIEALRFKTLGKWWWKGMWYYEKWVCRKADAVFFITEEDKEWAHRNYSLPKEKGTVITYGVDNKRTPSLAERSDAAFAIRNQYGIPASHRILLFNGDLGYEPNEQAVRILIDKIYPLLRQADFAFTIVICGRNLTSPLAESLQNTKGNIIYTGFVEDIKQVFLAADIFVNPVVTGGGIKTKLVEALSYNCSAVSTFSGATGIPLRIAGNKLAVVPDDDWVSFAQAIADADLQQDTGDVFYNHFYWGNIAREAVSKLENLQVQ